MEAVVLLGALAALLVIAIFFRRRAEGQWRTSSRGNATTIISGHRVTVFQSDGGWKYCIADPADGEAPYYSEVFETEDTARQEAVAHANGDPSALGNDDAMWISFLKDRGAALDMMRAKVPPALADKALSLDGATRLYQVLEEHAQAMELAIEVMHDRGVDDRIVKVAEKIDDAVSELAAATARKIFELRGSAEPNVTPRKPKEP